MKNLMFLTALMLVFLFPINGCKAIKHKVSERFKASTAVDNDIKVSKDVNSGVRDTDNYKSSKSNTTVKETITYKTPARGNDDTIELTASFKIDTAKSLKGDTALTLTGPGVSLTIVRDPRTNSLKATIKKRGSSAKTVDVNELRIDRTTTNNVELLDTTTSKLTWDNLKFDSVDMSQHKQDVDKRYFEKTKKTVPMWAIWLGVTAIVLGLVFLYFKRK